MVRGAKLGGLCGMLLLMTGCVAPGAALVAPGFTTHCYKLESGLSRSNQPAGCAQADVAATEVREKSLIVARADAIRNRN